MECSEGCSLQTVLLERVPSSQQFSVAVNHSFVMRADYANTILQANDQIDIIQPMQGG